VRVKVRGDPLHGSRPARVLVVLGVLVASLIEPLGGLAVLAWARWSGTPWRAIGYARPTSWLCTVAFGVAFGLGLKLFVKAIALPLLGADPRNAAYQQLVGNAPLLVGIALMSIVRGAFGEETFFRGFLFERLGKTLGSSVPATSAIVLLTTILFALEHYPDQGVAGVEQAMMTGLSFGAVYAVTRRIWPVMIAHAAYDVAAVAIIYWDLETAMAHLIFR
jgi:membrane protease YdiL (CAAX protease family)